MRKKTKRKVYYPKDATAGFKVIVGNRDQDPAHAASVVYAVQKSFERLKGGGKDRNDWDRVTNALNAALVRSELIAGICVEVIGLGLAGMESCRDIYKKHGKFGFYGPDIALVHAAVDLYAEIFSKSTPRQMEDAVIESEKRVAELCKNKS